jgi:hypothetical protein
VWIGAITAAAPAPATTARTSITVGTSLKLSSRISSSRNALTGRRTTATGTQ